MARQSVLRRGTAAFLALEKIHAAGGKATLTSLKSMVPVSSGWDSRFRATVTEPLVRHGYVREETNLLRLTFAGRRFMDSLAPITPAPAPANVAAPYRAPFRQLSPACLALLIEGRPGSLDYRNIPSLMGGERVPYKAACRPDGESGQD